MTRRSNICTPLLKACKKNADIFVVHAALQVEDMKNTF